MLPSPSKKELLTGLLLSVLLVAPSSAPAAGGAPGGGGASAATAKNWSLSLRGGGAGMSDAALDGGGEFRSYGVDLQGEATYAAGPRSSISLGLGYSVNTYDFSGPRGLASLSPWDVVHSVRAGVPVRWGVGDKGALFLIPAAFYSGEEGASFRDSLSGGGIAGFAYRFGDRLTLGPGVGVMTEIEDSPDVFPFLLVDWKVTGRLRLETGSGPGAGGGPGLVLRWDHSDRWDLFLGGSYEHRRFRLDEKGAVPGGVGDARSFPLYLGASRRLTPRGEIHAAGGVALGGRLRLEDQQGNRIAEEDHDPAGFLSVAVGVRY